MDGSEVRPDDVASATEDVEAALAQYAGMFSDGSFADLDFGSASGLVTRASASVDVAANALGVPAEVAAGVTTSDLWSRMMDPWFSADAEARARSAVSENDAAAEERRAARERAVFEGVPPDEARRAALDAELGDPSPLLRIKERFVFGR